MKDEEARGRRAVAFVGESKATYAEDGERKEATLQAALHDAAEQAALGGYSEEGLTVVSIAFTPGDNPHIKELSVIVTPRA